MVGRRFFVCKFRTAKKSIQLPSSIQSGCGGQIFFGNLLKKDRRLYAGAGLNNINHSNKS